MAYAIRLMICSLALALTISACAGDSGSACPDCDDGIACTHDTCIQSLGQCDHIPNDSLCSAGQICHRSLGCQTPGTCATADDCDDDNQCTSDSCQNGSCQHQNTCACSANGDCADGNECTDDTCDQGQCTYVPNSLSCDDGNPCTEQDMCTSGQCQGQSLVCDDDNECTDDGCDPSSGCTFTNHTRSCDDQDSCTAGDVCSGGACAGGEACCGDSQDNDQDGQTDCADSDCTGSGECSGCQAVALPDPVPMAPLPGEATPGRSESTSINGFDDDYIYDSTDAIKVGTRQEWGGTIIFFGQNVNNWPGVNSTNTIDANDTGREVQVAFYDPDRHMQNCAHDASCQSSSTECPFSITYLGWNPVQGGNRCNRGSGVESVTAQNGVQTVTVNPLFWNPNWDWEDCTSNGCDDPAWRERRSDVRVEQRLRFVRKHVVELQYTVTNLGGLNHASTAQEMPTVYTGNGRNNTPDLWRLFNSEGTEISIDQPGNDGFFFKNFSSPGGWACMQNDSLDYGVGLYAENRLTQMQGWQKRSLPFNNFRPIFPFAIPPYGTVMARSYLLLGSHAGISSEANWLDANLPPFGWLDEPASDAQVSGTIQVGGWVLDNKGVSAVEVLVDGTVGASLGTGGSRPDVCVVWPAYPGCPSVGYSGSLDVSGLSNCHHLLEIRATDTDGNQRIIARQRVQVSN